jgi:hypothetical protein
MTLTLDEVMAIANDYWSDEATLRAAIEHYARGDAEPVGEIVPRYVTERERVEGVEVWLTPMGEKLSVGALLYTRPSHPLTEGTLMGVYMDFDRTADKNWSSAEYLLHFARAVEREIRGK